MVCLSLYEYFLIEYLFYFYYIKMSNIFLPNFLAYISDPIVSLHFDTIQINPHTIIKNYPNPSSPELNKKMQ